MSVRVPLLSQEGLTCRLLPGATAPYPALDQEFVSTEAPADGFVFVLTGTIDFVDRMQSPLGDRSEGWEALYCPSRPVRPAKKEDLRRLGVEVS